MGGDDIKNVFDLHDELRRNRYLCAAAALSGLVTAVLAYHATFLGGSDEPKYEMLAVGFTILVVAGCSLFPLTEREKRLRGDMRRQNLLNTLSAFRTDEDRARCVRKLLEADEGNDRQDIITLYDYRCIDGIYVRHNLSGEDSTIMTLDVVRVLRKTFNRDLKPMSDETELNDKILDVIDMTLHSIADAERRRIEAQLGPERYGHDDIKRGVNDTRSRLNSGMPHKGYDQRRA